MKKAFFIVGPTASGKSDLAADVAVMVGGEVVNADAFQIYHGWDILTAKPPPATLKKAPHHLIGSIAPTEEMNAAKFVERASDVIDGIEQRGNVPIVVGGTGLYIKALTHGLSDLPAGRPELRKELDRLDVEQLRARLAELDPAAMQWIDVKNRRRLVRALEICLLTERPFSEHRASWARGTSAGTAAVFTEEMGREGPPATAASTEEQPSPQEEGGRGVFVFRERDELYERIDRRVESMFEQGVIKEVAESGAVGVTAQQMIGLSQIREHLGSKLSLADCIAAIQRSTRQYAKRQLTWFRRQLNFEPLNLSLLSHSEAVERIARRISTRRAEG